MLISSAKQKGRKLQQCVRDLILETFDSLEEDDVRSTSMGASGVDLLLSPAARKKFPFSVEAKNQETVSIWAWMEQAMKNTLKDTFPLLVFKRNRSKTYVTMELKDFLEIVKNTDFDKIFPKC